MPCFKPPSERGCVVRWQSTNFRDPRSLFPESAPGTFRDNPPQVGPHPVAGHASVSVIPYAAIIPFSG
jgi:hypothetical protein